MNLLNKHGQRFNAVIHGVHCSGKISVWRNETFLCQNSINWNSGGIPFEKFGYKYGYAVPNTLSGSDSSCNAYDFVLYPTTQQEMDNYKDWQVGDIVYDSSSKSTYYKEVIFRSGKLVCISHEKFFPAMFTCEQLYSKGYRLSHLTLPPKLDNFPLIPEYTMDELTQKIGHIFKIKQ